MFLDNVLFHISLSIHKTQRNVCLKYITIPNSILYINNPLTADDERKLCLDSNIVFLILKASVYFSFIIRQDFCFA